jgi:Mannosylglycerate hydrolase MGH1-like glycoside hydrolase domain
MRRVATLRPVAHDPSPSAGDPERVRLAEAAAGTRAWSHWGPYLAERQWGTVREDYSANGDAWGYLPHDQARSRAYRWGEDGLLGIADSDLLLCFAPALWNGRDPILKERLFGLTNQEGNHGEDVKELYYFLDATPSHSYLRAAYRYPQAAFPYADLVDENRRRGRDQPEYELLDTGVFDGERYVELIVEYAKAAPDDLVIRLSATNRGPESCPLDLLPTLWFRNTWSWGHEERRPGIERIAAPASHGVVLEARHHSLGAYRLACPPVEPGGDPPDVLFTDNETDKARLFGVSDPTPWRKDGIGRTIVEGAKGTSRPDGPGTKVACRYHWTLAAGETRSITLRLRAVHTKSGAAEPGPPGPDASEMVVRDRRHEADVFYGGIGPADMPVEARRVMRQAFAGLIWSRQAYHFEVARWLDGDPGQPPPPTQRQTGRDAGWRHLDAGDVLSMPDTWEYPWFASWDLAFHCVAMAVIDPEAAKRQLVLLCREWYMHPDGQLPAYEWGFGDVNPPVHAWAAWRVYKIARRVTGREDRVFLERIFLKLLLDFTWWVNRKDAEGRNVFAGGFLGLDNIGPFDRSAPIPDGGHLDQSDATAWMGMFCLDMLAMACELARDEPVYEDLATKFFEHFLYIAAAISDMGGRGVSLWDETDGFFYDVIRGADGTAQPLAVRSLVGLIPLLAVEVLEPEVIGRLPAFAKRMTWFLEHRPDLASLVASWEAPGMGERRLLALVHGDRLRRILGHMLDPTEFLSEHGVRSLSAWHRDHPFCLSLDGVEHSVDYEPGESTTSLFGGNSNWRGPVWFPIDFLLVEALQQYAHYYGDGFTVEYPTGSGQQASLEAIAADLSRRLISLFLPGGDGRRPVHGDEPRYAAGGPWADDVLFYEYFDGDTGRGLGASHQTGWTALVAKLIEQTGGR